MTAILWHDLDVAASFEHCSKALKTRSCRNFTVQFNADQAHCALDLDLVSVETLLREAHAEKQSARTRWIHFWEGETDAKAIEAIAKYYGMSSRLTASMCSARARPKSTTLANNELPLPGTKASSDAKRTRATDPERADGASQLKAEIALPKLQGFGDLVDGIWHFCSVSRGPQYLYIGYNALHSIPGLTKHQHVNRDKPSGLRVWTSLIQCSDGTIISIFEKPPDDMKAEHLASVHSNVLAIFTQLSKLHSSDMIATLMQVDIRRFGNSEDSEKNDANSSALLFYYLFDDWRTTYSLISRQDHPYRDTLARIRLEMFDAADTELVKSLDLVGRQLTVLKSMYQSYELIIQRILRHSNLSDSATQILPAGQGLQISTEDAVPFQNLHSETPFMRSPIEGAGICPTAPFRLPPSAAVRFERLLDRVRLYALAEIEECLKEKDSLVFMNFNLVALKESQAVEKLTRTTILLAKATILFLPVSLMTGYFSMQLKEVEDLYSLRTYWFCFLVVVLLSIVGLITFGITAERVEGKITYRSFTKTALSKLRRPKIKPC